MKTSLAISIAFFCLLALACKDQSGFSGGGSQEKRPTPQPAVPNSGIQQQQALPQATPRPTQPPLQPQEVVDGQEVFNDCGKCLLRAQQLSQTIGFMADMSRTINMGFYKIAPARNLCDIHFMADLSLPIADHNGIDTIGNGQVILYCPCNCGYSQDRGGGAGTGGFPPF